MTSRSYRCLPTAAERFALLHGNGSRAVIVASYGNRAYEDTLAELSDLASASDFRVIAPVAAIAEHSIAREIAAGRPDEAYAERLAALGREIRGKAEAGSDEKPALPGNRPYKKAGKSPAYFRFSFLFRLLRALRRSRKRNPFRSRKGKCRA